MSRTASTTVRLCLPLLALALAGCDADLRQLFGEGGIGGSGSGDRYADGGMGGSGSGTSSSHGSIYVDEDRRHYRIAEQALVRLDGKEVDPDTVNGQDQGLPLGMPLEYVLDEGAPEDLSEGTAIAIEARHRLIGPVTGTDPLEVMQQPVVVMSDTRADLDPDELDEGDTVKVAGHGDRSGTVRATRIVADTPEEWQLVGRASDPDESGFSIGDQRVEYNGVEPEDCEGTGPESGDKVLVRASPVDSPGETLDSVLEIRCLADGLHLFRGVKEIPEQFPAAVDGIVTGIDPTNPLLLELDGQKVDLSGVVEVLFGTLEQLRLGGRIEVFGSLDVDSGVLQAESLRFRDAPLSLLAPVRDALEGEWLESLGLTVRAAPGLEDPDKLFREGGEDRQAAIRGFVDAAAMTVYAQKIKDEGKADPDDILLEGPITGINEEQGQLFIAGVPFLFETAEKISLLEDEELILIGGVCLLGICLGDTSDTELPELPEGSTADLEAAGESAHDLREGELILRRTVP